MFDFITIPFAWLLLTLYNFTNSYGIALILFSIITKALLFYFTAKGKKGMLQTQRIQPKLTALQKQYKDDKQKLQQAQAKLYQDEEISPMSGCLWSLLPMPVLFALYAVIREPLKNLMKLSAEQITLVLNKINEIIVAGGGEALKETGYYQLELAQQVHNNFGVIQNLLGDSAPGLIDINFMFLGLNLAEIPKWPWQGLSWLILIPILSGASAYLMTWVSQKFSNQPVLEGQAKTMTMLMPLISIWFGFVMPAGMGIYWITNNLIGIVQDYFLTKHYTKILDAEAERRAEFEARKKAAEEEQKRIDREERAERLALKYQNKKTKVYHISKQLGKKKDEIDKKDE